MKKIIIEFTVEEINEVLSTLGNQPYIRVCNLIQSIQNQATIQLDKNNQNDDQSVLNDKVVKIQAK